MKASIVFFALVFSTILFIVNSKTTYEVHYISSAKINGTAGYADLSLEDVDYVYFSFDYELHNQLVPESKNRAFFQIDSELPLLKDKSLGFGFYDKNWSLIKDTDEIKKISYQDLKSSYYKKENDANKYYYDTQRTDDTMPTLLLRVPKTGYDNGTVTVENVLSIPNYGNFLFPKIFMIFLLLLSFW